MYVNGDSYGQQAHHDGYDRFNETQQFSSGFLEGIHCLGHQNRPIFL